MTSDSTRSVVSFESLSLFGFVSSLALPNRFTGIFFIALTINWLLKGDYIASFHLLRRSFVFYAVIAYFSTLLLSLLYTQNINVGFKALEPKLSLIAMPILIANVGINEERRNTLLRVFVLSMACISIYSIMTTIVYHEINFSDWRYFSFVLPETLGLSSTHYAMYILCALLVCIVGYFELKLMPTFVTILCSVYLTAFLTLISSRMPMIILLIVLTFYFVLQMSKARQRKSKRTAIVLFFSFLFGVTIFSLSVPYLRDRISQLGAGLNNDPRYFIFSSAFHIIEDQPLLGVGLGDVQNELNLQYEIDNFQEGLMNEYNSHNDWINSLLIGGILTFSTFLSIFVSCFVSAYTKPNFCKWAFIIIYGLAMQTETFLNRNKGVLLFSFILTLVFINKSVNQRQGENV